MRKSDFFWTDTEQAQERLQGTVVCLNKEPVYIDLIERRDAGPRASFIRCKDGSRDAAYLADKSFEKFRVMPKLGWFNSEHPLNGAILLERTARRSRSHGLTSNNVMCRNVTTQPYIPSPFGQNFVTLMYDKGFAVNLQGGVFPSLEQILINIEENSCIAYSDKFAVYRDQLGLRWLYRYGDRIGLFTGADTLNLLGKFSFHREEIMEDPAFTLNNIREF